MPEILFVCTANQFRSPLAAAYFQRRLQETNHPSDWKVTSAGTWTSDGHPAHPLALIQSARIGLDLSSHRSREVTSRILSAADLIIVMDKNHLEAINFEFPAVRSNIFLLADLAGDGPVSIIDPVLTDEDPAEVTDAICSYIDAAFDAILTRASARTTQGSNNKDVPLQEKHEK